ncbi:MAG: SUMF1/EgtB/PvdO family nonheme iron enzyme, partial [Verrucomicrobiota bacterium]
MRDPLPHHLSLPLEGGAEIRLVKIPGGIYRIGSREGAAKEQPVHRVTLSDFYLAETPVTQAQYAVLAQGCLEALREVEGSRGGKPSQFAEQPDHPVESVSWEEVQVVVQHLNEQATERLPAGYQWQIPSEAQWEAACLGVSHRRAYWNGDGEAAVEEIGWFRENEGQKTRPVRETPSPAAPHPQGLVGMHGNVQDWTFDAYDPRSYRSRGDRAVNPCELAGEVEVLPIFRSNAEVFSRFAKGERQLQRGDEAVLAQLLRATKPTQKGNPFWVDFEKHLQSIDRPGGSSGLQWPEEAIGWAERWAEQCRREVEKNDPDRVLRGGSWNSTAAICRAAYRNWNLPGYCAWGFGFRLAVVPVPVHSGDAGGGEQEGAERPKARPAVAGDPPEPDGPIALAHETFGPPKADDNFTNSETDPMKPEPPPYVSLEDPADQDWPTEPQPAVTRIVLGELKPGETIALASWKEPLADGRLQATFPNLKCLHLWGVDLETLAGLPDDLIDLDVQDCPQFSTLKHLPTSNLEVLVLRECSALAELPEIDSLPKLEEFELNGGQAIPGEWIHEVMDLATGALWKVDLSRCVLLTKISVLKKGIEDFRANQCPHLSGLPAKSPPQLRRLELANTPIRRLLPWVDSLDYINLTGTSQLDMLWDNGNDIGEESFPRTLFLYGSGIRKPPAILHGVSREENVATAYRNYLLQTRLVGTGSIRRCKLLFLGNGQSGKTSLALSLEPEEKDDVRSAAERAREKGSTHGIRLARRRISPADGADFGEDIRLDHWDFGGQEIYHNAHIKFVQSGSLFLVLWRREQDGKEKMVCPTTGYVDTLHPLRYWLDLIRTATDARGRTAIVASHETGVSSSLLSAFTATSGLGVESDADSVRNLSGSYAGVRGRPFAYDAQLETGDLEEIETWVRENATRLVEAEGHEVPIHWQIAESMVMRWVSERAEKRTELVSFEDFQTELLTEIDRRYEADSEEATGAFDQLHEAIQSGQFEIDEEITSQTLTVLSNLGVVYWSEDLFERKVIVGQAWALKGIYAALDRTEDSLIYRRISEQEGRFTRSDLVGIVWGEGSDYEDQGIQELLLSFMEDCQVAFCLRDRQWDGHGWRDPVYVSVKHLPSMKDVAFESRFQRDLVRTEFSNEPAIANSYLCRHHWDAVLFGLGRDYGQMGQYASDGFFLPQNEKGQSALIRVEFHLDSAVESLIWVETSGPEAREFRDSIIDQLTSCFPHPETGLIEIRSVTKKRIVGDPGKKKTLFISYARNNDPTVNDDDFDYEAPVRALKKELESFAKGYIDVLLDRDGITDSVKPEEGKTPDIVEFMKDAAKADRVLVV